MSRIGKAEAWSRHGGTHGATGAIARLPRVIREQLNHQLADGEQGIRLVSWLNKLPEVKTVLDQDFDGRPITEQNLSDWRQSGYEEWLSHEETRVWAARMAEEYDDLARESGEIPLPERTAYPALLALHALIHRDLIATDPEVQRRSIIQGCQQLTNLRRVCLQAERLRFEQKRWEAEQQEERDRNARRAEMRCMEQERLERFHVEARRDAQVRETFLSDLPFDIAAGLYGPPPQPRPVPTKSARPAETTKPSPQKAASKSSHRPPRTRRKRTKPAARRSISKPRRSSSRAQITPHRPSSQSRVPKTHQPPSPPLPAQVPPAQIAPHFPNSKRRTKNSDPRSPILHPNRA